MNYVKAYDNLIRTRKERVPVAGVYYENHHIVMKSMGGIDDPENLVRLTAREHFLAHWLLKRIHANSSENWKAATAFLYMCTGRRGLNLASSRAFAEARESVSGKGNPMSGKSVKDVWIEKYGEEESSIRWENHYRKISEASIGHKKKISPERKIEIAKSLSEKRIGKPCKNGLERKVLIDSIEYSSLTEAGVKLGMRTSAILWRCNSTSTKFKNYTFICHQ